MDVVQPFLDKGGAFGSGLGIGLSVAFVVWRQLVKMQSEGQLRSEALAVALNSIDKTLGLQNAKIPHIKQNLCIQ